jgi:flagellar motility protein MotE (MotC chaperone)
MASPTRVKTRTKAPLFRVLPALIFVGVLMLSVRVGGIWQVISEWRGLSDIGTVAGSVSVAELQAQQPPRRGATPPSPQQLAQAPADGAKGAQQATAPTAPEAMGGMSQTELDVLQKLSERRTTLDGRERDIERREALQKAAEDQIERKISEMKTLQHTIEGLLRQYNDQEDNKMRSLVKIYENMKPKEAAKIFEQLDMSILLEVVERMKEQRVAPIMAEMDPSKAKNITSELAQRRQIPMPKAGAGG